MKTALRTLLTITTLGASLAATAARADGPYGEPGYPGYDEQQPQYGQDPNNAYDPNNPAMGNPGDPNGQVYQPPPEGTCLDDNNQQYDCSNDSDYASYSQIDDGYDPSAYQDFQGTLSPYGNWINSPQYGQVWVPSAGVVGSDFTPYYSGGHWSMTDYGWTWVSDYNWGWAPFHYGRWINVSGHGWGWIPGRIWGPAWVHWRLGGGYVGWAALPPRGVRISMPGMGMGMRYHPWNFVPMGQITAGRLVRVAPPMAANLWGRTAVMSDLRSIGNTRIVYGPPLHHFTAASIHITPAPLASVHMAMPRAQIVVRPGVPLASRPYYAPVYRGGFTGSRPVTYPRPGYPSPGNNYPRPGYPAPVNNYPRAGYPPASTVHPAPGYHPGYPQQPAPGGYQHPGYPQQPAPGGYQHPGYPQQPAPGYQHPGYPQPAPGYQHPGYQQPSAPRPAYQPPAYQHPGYQQPAQPAYQHPSYQQPAYQHPSYQQPSAPRPAYQAPAYQHPSYQPPVHSAPSFQAPAPRPAPSYSAPAPHPVAPSAPMHSAPAGGHHH